LPDTDRVNSRSRNARPSAGSILIRTLPLSSNYGGILQAYALQRILGRLGAETAVDVSRASSTQLERFPRLRTSAKRIVARLGYSGPLSPQGLLFDGVTRAPKRFVARRINVVQLFDSPGSLNRSVLDVAGGFVVGSDQVWRRAYGDVCSYLLNFLPADDPRPRIAYAASFGRDDLDEYEPDVLAESARLVQRFDAISVREASGVRLAHDQWGVQAELHVDPTLLLDSEHYAELAGEARDPLPSGSLIDYVLDDEPGTRAVVAGVAGVLDEMPRSLMPPSPSSYRAYLRRPHLYRKPSVEAWLGAIGGARFVVTDSFHGTVFSILNNVPFIAVVNRDRGASRFESLLDTFGLRGRLLEPGEVVRPDLAIDPIDWDAVNARIEHERQRSMEYLRRALGSMLDTDRRLVP